MKTNLEFDTYNALIQNGYLDRAADPRHGLPPSSLDPDNHHRIDPALYDDKAGEVDRSGGGINPLTGKQFTAEEEYEYWKSGPHPDEQDEPDYNGAPSRIFGSYLTAYAGAAHGNK